MSVTEEDGNSNSTANNVQNEDEEKNPITEADEQIKEMSLTTDSGNNCSNNDENGDNNIPQSSEGSDGSIGGGAGESGGGGSSEGGSKVEDIAPSELSDPAILVVKGTVVKFRYGKEELLKLREAPLSQRKPDFLDIYEVSPTIWDPTRWNFDRKKTDTPTENGTTRTGGEILDHKRAPRDPRERIRKENDGIVLSPQRRSFNSGCFVRVTTVAPRANRPHSPLGKSDPGHNTGVQLGTRRIGSGRILRDTWDFTDKPDSNESEYNFRGNSNHQPRNNQDNQDTRRNFGGGGGGGGNGRNIGGGSGGGDDGREKDNRRGGNQNSRFGGGGSGNGPDRRRMSDQREQEEPEWFSGGPSSQNDTIELRGFDENEKLGSSKKKMSPSQAKRARDWYKKKSEVASITEEKDDATSDGGGGGMMMMMKDDGLSLTTQQQGGSSNGNSAHDPTAGGMEQRQANKSLHNSNINNNENDSKKNKEKRHDLDGLEAINNNNNNKIVEQASLPQSQSDKNINDHSFIFDDILKSDSIPGLPGLLTNGVGGEGDHSGQSRFSKWFATETNTSTVVSRNESRRSSSGHEETIIKNLLKDINEPSVTIPGDSDSYFAPISPAANTGGSSGGVGGNNMGANSRSINIMEVLQRSGGGNNKPENNLKPQMSGRVMNLADLEAKIRQQNSEPQMHRNQQKSEDDMSAFNRLLAQVSGGHAVTANGPMSQKPMSLMEMLNHSQQQDEAQAAAARMAQMLSGGGPTSPSAAINSELAARLHQKQQMEMLNKLGLLQQQMRASPLQEMGVQQSRELLQRPEAQAILQGLKVGDITPQHLYQQLGNPALQPRHRELLATILKQCGAGGGGNSAGGSSSSGGGSGGVIGHSPRVLSPVGPHPLLQQQQQQQQQPPPQQQQLRVSPLPPNAYCVSPIMATSPNTLTVPAIHQRIPSPRELQVHTQNILQRALIKKKLEEQQENYRKKQEMQQRGQSPNNSSNNNSSQPTKSMASPTPLAFTPTSVLRKMTAEKDDGKDVSKLVDGGKLMPGRALTGMRQPQTTQSQSMPPQSQSQQQQQQQPPQSIGQWPFPINMKQAGRPIVKANNFQQQQQQQQQQPHQQHQQQDLYSHQQKLFSQLQQHQHEQQFQQQQQQRNKGWIGGGHMNHPQFSNSNQFSQLTQQQLRAQHQQHARPANQPQQQQSHMSQQQQQQPNYGTQSGNNSWQYFNPNHRANQLGRGGLNDGDLSPTTNQLTRWFSPDLLERARVGELPSTEGLAQHVLSLEEIERITAPPVHN